MNKLSVRRLAALLLFSILLTALFSILITTNSEVLAGEASLGPPPEITAEPGKSAANGTDAQTAAFLPLVELQHRNNSWLDTQSRETSKAFYLGHYGPQNVAAGWTGNTANCNPGTTSPAYNEAILVRINYFRTMAGLPPISGFKDGYNQKAQAAALMMSVNKKLSHSPDTSWKCYSDEGREGAGSSNLYLGVSGPGAITGYINDPGSNNYPVGHRRWILYPQTQMMGVGNIPSGSGAVQSNALWVFDKDNMWGARPETRDSFVAWPTSGYVPYMLAFPRWSFAFPGADFKNATVTMVKDGSGVGVSVQPVRNGYGENTLVWEPDPNTQEKPDQDTVYQVSVKNVVIDGAAVNFNYTVILFDPAQ